MGGCIKAATSINHNVSKYSEPIDQSSKSLHTSMHPDEIFMLNLIYQDLAQRHPQNKIDEESFFLFFQLNGMWGQMLFDSFDLDQTALLNFQQFVQGISKYVKVDQNKKILVLFNFLQGESLEGISYHSFMKMLYNYPKKYLKKIINTKEIFEQEIMNHVKQIKQDESKQNQQTIEHCGSIITNIKSQEKLVQIVYSQPDENTDKLDKQKISLKKVQTYFQKTYKKFIKYKDPGTCLQFKYQNKTYSIKSVNMNRLIKNFAVKIYQDYNINLENGKLGFQQFKDWIQKHPELYNSYYQKFHNTIWQKVDEQYLYIKTLTEIQSKASLVINNSYQNVFAFLIDTTIMICKDKTKKQILYVICLQGLRVDQTQIFSQYGIKISHREGLYLQKNIMFKTQEIQIKWLQLLSLYKGQSIHEKYIFHEKIGTGQFSIVFRGEDNPIHRKKDNLKKQYAIKVIQTTKLTPQQKNYIAHQSAIIASLNNPNIIKLIQSIQSKTHLYIVTELAQGVDLFDYVRIYGRYIREYQAALIIGQILQAVKYLHSLGIIHRDLKPDNIMVILKNVNKWDQIQRIKLIDFGYSDYITNLKENKQFVVGTINYIAPQSLIEGDINYKVDNFAIGVIMYFLLSFSLPFDAADEQQILEKTKRCQYNMDQPVWRNHSEASKDLIRRFLTKNPQDRISLDEALNHEWFLMQQKSDIKQKIQ